jgi:hypothetical protein
MNGNEVRLAALNERADEKIKLKALGGMEKRFPHKKNEEQAEQIKG